VKPQQAAEFITSSTAIKALSAIVEELFELSDADSIQLAQSQEPEELFQLAITKVNAKWSVLP
jgi:hypothetical protein